MAWYDAIANFATGNAMPLISSASSLIGGLLGNQSRQEQASNANQFSASQFASRYQTTTKDMMAAGLNPMLAYTQGGGSPPIGQQAQLEDIGGAVGDSFNRAYQNQTQSRVASAQIANIEADTSNKAAQANLWEAQALAAKSSAYQADTQGALNEKTVDKVKADISKITQETRNLNLTEPNIKWQTSVLGATVDSLVEQTELNRQKGMTEMESRAQIRATISKLMTETDLNKLDLKAAQDFSNLGRDASQVKPILDIIKMFLRK